MEFLLAPLRPVPVLGQSACKFHSNGISSRSASALAFFALVSLSFQCIAAPAGGDPGARAVQEQLLQRQQQHDALQLRMQQQQRAVQSPPADARLRQVLEQQQAEQRQRLQTLHDRQQIEPSTAHPVDDEGTRRAKAEMKRREAEQESARELRRSESEAEKSRP